MATLPKVHARRDHDPGKLFRVEKLDLEFSNGEKRTYERLCSHGLGAVIVVALQDNDTVILVREYAAGLHHYELGLVKGRLEAGETILEGAERELKEEIGFGARSLIELTALSLAPGYMTHITHVVLARDLYHQKLKGDEPEELEIVEWPLADLHTLVQRPDCTEGRSIAALYITRDYLQQEKNMLVENLQHTLGQLVDISRRAGLATLEWYDGDMGITQKTDASPLTKADLASHKLINTALQSLWPEIPVLSEESADIPWETRQSWQKYWLVDPLDGTKEFINHNGEFTVNIALIRDHQPVMGVVHVPVTGMSYFGAVGEGAWSQHEAKPARRINIRCPAAQPAVIVGSRSHANPELASQLDRLGPHELISMGSSLKFCRVAEGLADFYPRLGPTCEWDTAAAQAVVEAAGGRVVRIDGSPLSYNRKESYLNPHFFVIGDAQKEWLLPFQDMN